MKEKKDWESTTNTTLSTESKVTWTLHHMLAVGKLCLILGIQSRCSGGRLYWQAPESGTWALKGSCTVLSLETPSKDQLLIHWVLAWSAGLAIGKGLKWDQGRAQCGGNWSDMEVTVEISFPLGHWYGNTLKCCIKLKPSGKIWKLYLNSLVNSPEI
jgi:hypothetical protein